MKRSTSLISSRSRVDLARFWRALDAGALDRVLTLPAEDADTHHLRAVALQRALSTSEALSACDHALRLDPDHVGALLTRGALHSAEGSRMTALQDFRRARRCAESPVVARHLIRASGGADFSAPLHAEVVELFDRYAPTFDAHLVEGLNYCGHERVPAMVVEARPEAWGVTWDLGCGSGLCGPALRERSTRLVGVDISPAMVEKARDRGCYDVLFPADLVYALTLAGDNSAGVLLSADVLGYLGPLEALFEQAARVLEVGGMLAFSVEAAEGCERLIMQPSRRCAYNSRYLTALGVDARLQLVRHETLSLRRESDRDVPAHAMLWQKCA